MQHYISVFSIPPLTCLPSFLLFTRPNNWLVFVLPSSSLLHLSMIQGEGVATRFYHLVHDLPPLSSILIRCPPIIVFHLCLLGVLMQLIHNLLSLPLNISSVCPSTLTWEALFHLPCIFIWLHGISNVYRRQGNKIDLISELLTRPNHSSLLLVMTSNFPLWLLSRCLLLSSTESVQHYNSDRPQETQTPAGSQLQFVAGCNRGHLTQESESQTFVSETWLEKNC